MKKLIALLFITSLAHASELEIRRFALLDPYSDRNSAAEVCLKMTPAPKTPVLVQLTVDPGTRVEASYNAWIDQRGKVCSIVSTLRGRIEAKVADKTVQKSL